MTVPSLPPRSVPDQWPDPVELHGANGRSPVVLLCEHASNYIPPEYAGLGMSEPDLQRHIAWDIGAAQVARHLSRLMDAPAFLGTYSRLMIDLNRPLGVRSSIVTRSEATDIPGNVSLSAEERAKREELIFKPHHTAIEAHLKQRVAAGRKTFIIAIHSFTPIYMGSVRPWHVGVLFDKGVSLAEATMARLRAADPTLNVGANVPYAVSIEEDYGLLVHGDHAGNPAILIEIRQDLIAIPEAAEDWARRLAPILTAVCV
jgi:predicted N-formylglutamate amidohydrolase